MEDFFDCNCMLGPTATNRERPFGSAEALLEEMDKVGIAEALVYSSLAYHGHPSAGNERIIKDTSTSHRLHPCWVLLPPTTDEMPRPNVILEQMRDTGVRAVRILPSEHKYPFSRTVLGELLDALSEECIPLFVDMNRNHWSEVKHNWDEVFAVCEAFPDLPVILIREGGTTQRILYGSWERHANLYLETSYFQMPEGLSDVCRRFGKERLLFGTNMPISGPGGPMAMIHLSNLSQNERQAISGDNLRCLLKQERCVPVTPRADVRPLRIKNREGATSTTPPQHGYRVFDAHGHLGHWGTLYCPVGTAERTIEVMNAYRIERFAVSDFLALGADYHAGNTRVGEAIAKYPDRIIGYAVYNPNYESKMSDEMRRCFEELGMSGMKLHCGTHQVDIEDNRYRRAFSIANDRHKPMLVHGSPSPLFLRELLRDYPDLTFIMAHAGGQTIKDVREIIQIAREFQNLILDLAASGCHRGFLKWLVGEIGSEQITYGSDFPMMDFGWQLGRILYADIPQADKQRILFYNADKVFS